MPNSRHSALVDSIALLLARFYHHFMTNPSFAIRIPYRHVSKIAFLMVLPCLIVFAARPSPSEPWTSGQTITPADFAKEIAQNHDRSLKIVYVGVHTLYAGGHIPGAVFHGPGSTEEGLADLRKYGATLPKDSDIVIYCGCCPLDRCPNLRPAFSVLKELGFSHIRVLILPTSFAADWIEKGYPVEKGS